MSGKIFVLRAGEGLVELQQERYENEDLFQTLIEQYPAILAGDQMTPDNPRRWLLISREMNVPLDEGRGSLDHFYVDQDAIPTFIEVKRGTDTRIRREVVGQMLDYAANGKRYWSIGMIRELYDKHTHAGGVTLTDIGVTEDAEETFWQTADRNLRNGKIRLLFVADEIPDSLQAIIEYLNEQMTDTEVFGIEIKQFVGTDGITKTLVPNLVGRTAKADNAKSASGGSSKQKYANRDEFFNSMDIPTVEKLYKELFAFADKHSYKIGMGTAGFSFNVVGANKKTNTLLFGYGTDAQWDNRKNCIETTFWLSKEMSGDVLKQYKDLIGKLNFFEPTQSGNFKWQLTSESTDGQIQELMTVIEHVVDKINGGVEQNDG